MHRFRIVVAASLLVLLSAGAARAQRVEVGDPILDFSLPDLNGRIYTASEFRGKALVVYLIGYD